MDVAPDDVWPAVVKAFAFYGKQLRPLKGARRKALQKVLAEGYTLDELVAAVHGYVRQHDGLDREWENGKTARQFFTPESVLFVASKLEPRIELGEAGPWVYVSKQEQHERAVKAKQEAARQRVEAARRLKAV